MLIDELVPTYDAFEHHEIIVHASPAATYKAVKTTNFGRSVVVTGLMAVRGIPTLFKGGIASRGNFGLDSLSKMGFTVVREVDHEEIVLGLIGRFWLPSGKIQSVRPQDFEKFDEPGFAKAYWSFRVEPHRGERTRLMTETRVVCTSSDARRWFRAYFKAIRPFSGLIRHLLLIQVRTEAEGRRS